MQENMQNPNQPQGQDPQQESQQDPQQESQSQHTQPQQSQKPPKAPSKTTAGLIGGAIGFLLAVAVAIIAFLVISPMVGQQDQETETAQETEETEDIEDQFDEAEEEREELLGEEEEEDDDEDEGDDDAGAEDEEMAADEDGRELIRPDGNALYLTHEEAEDETANLDEPNQTSVYASNMQGIENLVFPCNADWGSENYKINCWDYVPELNTVLWGPVGPGEGGGWGRMAFMHLEEAMDVVSTQRAVEENPDYGGDFIDEPQNVALHGFKVVRFQTGGLGTNHHIIVTGGDFNYHFRIMNADDGYEQIEEIIETLELM